MKYGILIVLGLITTALLLIGCAQQQTKTLYQCQDGTTVYDISMCPNPQTPQEEPTPERRCALSTQESGGMVKRTVLCFYDDLGMAECVRPGKQCENTPIPMYRVITESLECVNNRCTKETTIVKDCRDYGSDWACGYDEDDRVYCTDLSELIYI